MKTHHLVACTACGCVCDDLSLTFDGQQLVDTANACKLARQKLMSLNQPASPAARVHGTSCNITSAIDQAAEILKASHFPLIYGLSRSSTQGQRAAISLADRLGAVIDTTASICHGPSIMAIQEVGESTCTLGEIASRGDLVIFWGANPAVSHPRHFERYSLEPTSQYLPNGRSDRHVVVIDVTNTETTAIADEVIHVTPRRDYELITSLRRLLRDPHANFDPSCDVTIETLRQLVERMKACRYGVVFFGLGLAQTTLGHLTIEALLELVAELNAHTRFTARRLRIPGDVSGADSVLCWQTGFPFGVDLTRGIPRYNPGEFTAEDLLERGEVDACLIVGSESLPTFSQKALAHLQQIPTIVLDEPHAKPPVITPHVAITTAVYGIHAEGTAYRMDEVPLPLHKLVEADWPTDADVLKQIERTLIAEPVAPESATA